MVLDILGQDDEPVAFSRQARGNRSCIVGIGLAEKPGGVGGRIRSHVLCRRVLPGPGILALRQCMGIGRDPPDLVEPYPRPGHQVEVDVHDDLALYVEVHVEDEAVDGRTHRALDRVLYRDEAQVRPPVSHLVEDGGDGGEWAEVSPGQVGLGEQRLLGEGGCRAEVGDRGRGGIHSRGG